MSGYGWAPGATRPLTRQELIILDCAANGMSNEEIAVCLELSKNTVKVHKFNAYVKLGLNGKTKGEALKGIKDYFSA
jgi:DNA-binding CsgD family transcriptional regulator